MFKLISVMAEEQYILWLTTTLTLVSLRHQAMNWVTVDPDLSHHIASIGHNELMSSDMWLIACGKMMF